MARYKYTACVYFYLKKAFYHRRKCYIWKCYARFQVSVKFMKIQCISWRPACCIPSHALAGPGHTMQRGLKRLAQPPCQGQPGQVLQGELPWQKPKWLSGCGCAWSLCELCTIKKQYKIHLESLILHFCTKSYPNGNHLLYTYAL